MFNNNVHQAVDRGTTLRLFDQGVGQAIGTFCSGLSVIVLAPLAQELLEEALTKRVPHPALRKIVATTAIGAFAPSSLMLAHQAGKTVWSWTKQIVGQGCSYAGLWNRAALQQNAERVQQDIPCRDDLEEEDLVVVGEEGQDALEQAQEVNDELRANFEDFEVEE